MAPKFDFTYTDVSLDPTASARVGVPAELAREVEAMGAITLGYAQAVLEGKDAMVTQVLRVPSGVALLSLTRCRLNGYVETCFESLFEDGSIVLTTRKPPRGWHKLAAGMRHRARDRAHLRAVPFDASMDDQLRAHMAQVRRVARERDTQVLLHDTMDVHFARRLRAQELRTPRMHAMLTSTLALTALAFLGILAAAVAVGRAGDQGALSSVFIGLSFASLLLARVFDVCLHYLSPWIALVVARTPSARSGEALVAMARQKTRHAAIGELAAEAAAEDGPHAPIPVEATADQLARWRRRDLVVSIATAVVFPALAVGALSLAGHRGLFVIWSAQMILGGGMAFAMGTTPQRWLRAKCLPDLVARERTMYACAGSACAKRGSPAGVVVALGGWALLALALRLPAPYDATSLWTLGLFTGLTLYAAVLSGFRVSTFHERLRPVPRTEPAYP